MDESLQHTATRLKAIFETVVDGIITIDERGIIESMNPAATRLFGWSEKEAVGHNISILMPSPDRERHDSYMQRYQQTREARIIGIGREVIGLRKDGSTFPFSLGVSEIVLDDKVIYTGIVHDLTEQKNAQDALANLNAQLEARVRERTEELGTAIERLKQANNQLAQEVDKRKEAEQEALGALEKEMQLGELKSRFVSMASHEFRTPLAGILSSVSLLARYTAPEQAEKRNKHISRIRSSVQNLTTILNDFLSLDKLEAGKTKCQPVAFNLPELVAEVLDDMQQMRKQDQQIIYENTNTDTAVTLDPHLVKNILINLLSNAIKYSDIGSNVHLTSTVTENEVQLIVIDNGIGIPQEEQKQLFERFFRAGNATNIQGTGLGLTIVQRYLDLMDGSIGFESTEGQGTTFTVKLPRRLDK